MRLGRVAALALVVAAWGPTAEAASLTLGDHERQEALKVGERSVTTETFGDEWRIVNGAGQKVVVYTPFHRLALAARHAAFKNEPLKLQEQERMLAELKDRLMLQVALRGPKEDFARYLTPRLRMGDREIEPSIVQNERTALPQEDGRFLARCTYWFPAETLTGTSRVVLMIRRAPAEHIVAEFDIDLARMR